MFVSSIMIPKHKSITVQLDQTVDEVLNILERNEIDGVPVLDEQRYVGMVTRYQIYRHFFEGSSNKEQFLKEVLVGKICTHQNTFLTGDEKFESILLSLKDFPALAVVDSSLEFKGLVTRYEVLEQFQSAFGMKKNGVRITITSIEAGGRLARLAEVAKQYHEQIISIVTFDETDKLVRRIVLKIEKKDNIPEFLSKLEKNGFRVLEIFEEK
ncbi:CBS domain-containing protein [Bacillus carboniphilus]|uniref:CBS domain-containing protein n=1 Tax=Bacillus carboniphilus TaxID=86663 RepID=A0ABY9JYB9_9BACI|nr:CBS domain-containing protein [Bacillus carboniphilus]WLR43763.1 CBS domain-containing protein [Bacillus carboniphilus]